MTSQDSLTPEQWNLISKHLDGVIRANSMVNLTRITTPEEGLLLHIEDSLAALPEMDKAPAGLYGDIGSGGGYPGIPLAIATGRQSVLVDSRKKKMEAVQSIIDELGLSSQISTYAGRAELLARQRPQAFAVITARALGKLPVLLELASPLLQSQGHLICYKAQMDPQELQDAQRVRKATGMELISDRTFTLGNEITRRILAFQKTTQPTMKLPRQEGLAQKSPL